MIKVGRLVKYIDWDSTGGFAPPYAVLGLVINVHEYTCPHEVEILTLAGDLVYQYEDELEIVQ